MKKNLLYLFIYVGAVGSLAACTDSWDDQYSDKPFAPVAWASLSVGTDQLEFDHHAGTQSVSISAVGMWTVRTSQSWLKADAEKGSNNATLAISVDEYTSTTSSREGTVTISNGIQNHTIKVRQTAMQEVLTISSTSLSYGFQEGSNVITVSANVNWSVSCNAGWVTLSKNADGTAFAVRVQQNLNTTGRQAVITVKGVTLSREISVSQSAVRQPSISALAQQGNITKHEAQFRIKCESPDLAITEYGICYSSTAAQPDKNNATVVKRTGSAKSISETIALTGLKSKTTYTARPYVVTLLGTQYGPATQFTTPVSSPNPDDNGTPND